MAANIKEQEYNAEQIQVLEGLDPVRKRPGMYIGSTGPRGLHHLVYEIVDNSIDEALAGYCKSIAVTILKDNAIEVIDDGRGMPVDIHPKLGIPAVEVIHTVLHAGGKFGGGGYKVSGGLHGVGASVVNALSEFMEVEVKRNGNIYRQTYAKGKTTSKLEIVGEAKKTGTKTTFKPDPEIFDDTVYDYDTLEHRLREMAFLNKGIKISLKDERDGRKKSEVFHYEGGLREYVAHLNKNKEAIHPDIIYFENKKKEYEMEVSMQYTDRYNELLLSYANNINTTEGGTHMVGFKIALTKVMNDYAKKINVLKNDDKFAGEDVREGICAIVSVKLQDAQFEGQTKAKLGNSDMRTFVYSMVTEKLSEYLEENPAVGKMLSEKCLQACTVREAARKARDSARKGALSGNSLPGKLWDCREKRVDVTELFLVEGNSAGGSAKEGRNSEFQAVLPMRGKVLNVEKSRLDKVYSNSQLIPIIQALGCGIGDEFNLEKLRYGKSILMADADVDGSHIRILLLTFFFRHMRELIEEGHIFLAQPPLYMISRGKQKSQVRYAFSDEERDLYVEELGGADKVEVQRYKGLGEMDPEQLRETTMDPEKRTLLKVTVEDAMACDQIFSILMGDQVEPRREFIEANAQFASDLDI